MAISLSFNKLGSFATPKKSEKKCNFSERIWGYRGIYIYVRKKKKH